MSAELEVGGAGVGGVGIRCTSAGSLVLLATGRGRVSECLLASGCLAFPFLHMVLGTRFIGEQSPGLGGQCSCVPLFSAVPQVCSVGLGQSSSGGGQDADWPLLGPQAWVSVVGLTLMRGGRIGSVPTWSCCPSPPPQSVHGFNAAGP